MKLSRYVGDKAFYRRVLAVAVPIMLQNGITNFVNMLDNLMVGRVGTLEMTGVAVANQLFFVFQLCLFGAVSGAGIFGAQFYGKGDHEGLRHSFRFKILLCTVLVALCAGVFWFGGEWLIGQFLQGEGAAEDAAASLGHAQTYLRIMMISMIPNALIQTYASTLRETGETMLPMKAGVISVFVNLVLNALLIFGYLGFPKLGVAGAAIATAASQTFGGLLPLLFFARENDSTLRLGRMKMDWKALIQACGNGSSEFVTNISMSVVGMLYNVQLLAYAGQAGIAAYGVIMYVSFFFVAIFLGYSIGVSPIIGYHYGAENSEELRNVFGKSMNFVAMAVFMLQELCFGLYLKTVQLWQNLGSLQRERFLTARWI